MTALWKAEIRLTLVGPFLMKGLATRAFGLDAAQLRDGSGRALIPAGQIRGVIRQAAEELGDLPEDAWRRLFGEAPETGVDGEESRGALSFTDLVAHSGARRGDPAPRLTTVAIDDETGAAEEGKIRTVEAVAQPGEEVEFAGVALFLASSEAEAMEIAAALDSALAIVPAIGAFKTIGYGEVRASSVTLDGLVSDLANPSAADPGPGLFELRFRLDRALMIAPGMPEGNVFVSAETIPGSVLKGALARRLVLGGWRIDAAEAKRDRSLTRLRIGAAQPWCDDDALAPVGDHAALQRGKGQLGAPPPGDAAASLAETLGPLRKPPSFFHDEKRERIDPDDRSRPPAPSLRLDVRTRVAIQEGVAKDTALFTHIAIDSDGVEWRAEVDLPEGDEAAPLRRALADGLFDIGKTKAAMVQTRLHSKSPAPEPCHGRWRLRLLSPAHLVRAAEMKTESSLLNALEGYWIAASRGALRVVQGQIGEEIKPLIFASQSLLGGAAVWRLPQFDRSRYEPLVLTEAGSVFILEGAEEPGGAACLDTWQRHGLPRRPDLPEWPYTLHTRENGYGACEVTRWEGDHVV